MLISTAFVYAVVVVHTSGTKTSASLTESVKHIIGGGDDPSEAFSFLQKHATQHFRYEPLVSTTTVNANAADSGDALQVPQLQGSRSKPYLLADSVAVGGVRHKPDFEENFALIGSAPQAQVMPQDAHVSVEERKQIYARHDQAQPLPVSFLEKFARSFPISGGISTGDVFLIIGCFLFVTFLFIVLLAYGHMFEQIDGQDDDRTFNGEVLRQGSRRQLEQRTAVRQFPQPAGGLLQALQRPPPSYYKVQSPLFGSPFLCCGWDLTSGPAVNTQQEHIKSTPIYTPPTSSEILAPDAVASTSLPSPSVQPAAPHLCTSLVVPSNKRFQCLVPSRLRRIPQEDIFEICSPSYLGNKPLLRATVSECSAGAPLQVVLEHHQNRLPLVKLDTSSLYGIGKGASALTRHQSPILRVLDAKGNSYGTFERQGPRFVLSCHGKVAMFFAGTFSEHRVEVQGANGALLAKSEPVNMCPSASFMDNATRLYQVCIEANVDAGLILIGLLAIEKIWSDEPNYNAVLSH